MVILDKAFYHTRLNNMLLDQDAYVKLKGNPTNKYKKELKQLVEFGYRTRVLTKREKRYLIPSACRVPTIYTLPKIHKRLNNHPARLIVNRIGSVTARLGP